MMHIYHFYLNGILRLTFTLTGFQTGAGIASDTVDQLGQAKFESFTAEGHTMTMEQAIVFAIEKSDG
jgi:hypothetical protein